jgi:poly-gamma-glutamate capsule biosynthesis protein CapA/YwtB (metallophosphatase superfamily)
MDSGSDGFLRRVLRTMDRRTLLGRGAAMAGAAFAGLSLRPGRAYGQQAKPSAGRPGGADTWNVVVAGETMAYRPFSMHTEPEFLSVVKLLRESDVTYTHLEMNLGSPEELGWAARGAIGRAGYLIADPRIAEDLKWAGVDMMSLGHNHSLDWGPEGMLSTIRACRRSGIVHAGTGRDLEEARGPAFLEKDKGRVALVSISSGNSAYEWAGLGKGPIPGRPGVNPLRATMRYELDHATAEQYKEGARKLGVLSVSRATPSEFNVTPGQQAGATGFSSFTFVDGDKFGISTVGHPKDIEGNLRSIDAARQMADLVIVAHHNSLSEGGRGDLPCRFAREFARAAIDAGADIYVGHGWHKALGIEIYEGKPIMHGLGNFFWQSSYITRVPPDEYESYGYDMDALTTLTPAVGPLHPAGDEHWAYSVVYQLRLEDKKLKEIRLYPVEMGMDLSAETPRRVREYGTGAHKVLDGRPLMASGATARKILERIQTLSATYGTRVEIEGGVGVARVSA